MNFKNLIKPMNLKKKDKILKREEKWMIKLLEIKKLKININKKFKRIKRNLWDLLKKGKFI